MNPAEWAAAWGSREGLDGSGVKKRWWNSESVVVILLIDVNSLMNLVFLTLNRGIIAAFRVI